MSSGSLVRRSKGPDSESATKVRLQRVLADAGVAARRACEVMIEEGRVKVNGEVRRKLPVFVNPETDHIEVNGRPLSRESIARPRYSYVMLHKPARVLTVGADEPGADRRTVMDIVKHHTGARLFPVGRLGYDATGLVLMTNDGELANRLTHPRYEVPRTYHALISGTPDEATLSRLERDIHKFQLLENRAIGRRRAGRVSLRVIGKLEGKTVLEITLREGVNRQVEQTLELAGFPIKKFMQVTLGPIELSGLAEGGWRDLERGELAALRKAVRDNATSEQKEPRSEKDPRGFRPKRGPGGPRGPRPAGGMRRLSGPRSPDAPGESRGSYGSGGQRGPAGPRNPRGPGGPSVPRGPGGPRGPRDGRSGPARGGPGQGRPNQGRPNQGRPNQGRPNQGRPNQGRSGQGRPR